MAQCNFLKTCIILSIAMLLPLSVVPADTSAASYVEEQKEQPHCPTHGNSRLHSAIAGAGLFGIPICIAFLGYYLGKDDMSGATFAGLGTIISAAAAIGCSKDTDPGLKFLAGGKVGYLSFAIFLFSCLAGAHARVDSINERIACRALHYASL
jgi:hypothetical protein